MNPFTSDYMHYIYASPYLEAEEERALLLDSAKGDQKARDKLILSYLRLVSSIAKKYKNEKSSLEDLIQEGTLGLMYAVENFDIKKNDHLSSYASLWITEFIKRRVYKNIYEFSVPFRVIIKSFQMNREGKGKPLVNSKDSSEERDIRELMNHRFVSIHDSAFQEQDNPYINSIADPLAEMPEKTLEMKDLRYFFKNEIPHILDSQEQYIIERRFIRDTQKPLSYREIAKDLDCSPETVRNIEKKAKTKLLEHLSGYIPSSF